MLSPTFIYYFFMSSSSNTSKAKSDEKEWNPSEYADTIVPEKGDVAQQNAVIQERQRVRDVDATTSGVSQKDYYGL